MRRNLLFAVAILVAIVLEARGGDEPVPTVGVVFEAGSPSFADVLAKAKAAGKPVFIDFFTESCVWCKKLDIDVFGKAQTGETMKAFVNLRVDVDAGEGAALAKRYRVNGYPTLLVVDAEGLEIDRIDGFEPLDEFNDHVHRILRGEDTIADFRKRHGATPDDPALALEYGEKLAPSDPGEAEKLFAAAIASKSSDRPTVLNARLGRAGVLSEAKRHEEALEDARAALALKPDDMPVQVVLGSVYPTLHGGIDSRSALGFLDAATSKATGSAANVAFARLGISYSQMDNHLRAIVESLRMRVAAESALHAMQPGNPNGWTGTNYAAWTCFLMKRNLTEAIQWARTAVERSHDEPTTLDTLANLLWLSCENHEALALEERAAANAEGGEKREYAGTLAKWRVELEMLKSAEEEQETAELEDDNYVGILGPCGK